MKLSSSLAGLGLYVSISMAMASAAAKPISSVYDVNKVVLRYHTSRSLELAEIDMHRDPDSGESVGRLDLYQRSIYYAEIRTGPRGMKCYYYRGNEDNDDDDEIVDYVEPLTFDKPFLPIPSFLWEVKYILCKAGVERGEERGITDELEG